MADLQYIAYVSGTAMSVQFSLTRFRQEQPARGHPILQVQMKPTYRNPSTWNSLLDVLRAWWRSDQVRIEPAAGRLLAISAGSRILMHDSIWTVTVRDVQTQDSYVRVRYVLDSDRGLAELFVNFDSELEGRSPTGVLKDGSRTIPVWDADVIVLTNHAYRSASSARGQKR